MARRSSRKENPRVRNLIVRYARKYGVDPQAALAVARGEGGIRWGAVGDQGTSFGPFQLHVGGALPKGKGAAWANSPAGLEYAIRSMANVGARGLRGAQAVETIVRKFERPADPDTSVSRAVARLGRGQPVDTSLSSGAEAGGRNPSLRAGPYVAPQVQQTLNEVFGSVGLPQLLPQLGDIPLPSPQTSSAALPSRAAPPIRAPKMPKLDLMLSAIQKAQSLGLRVSENPYVDDVDPVHTQGSHHYQTLGRVNGKKVGRAIDVSGDSAAMQAFFKWAERYAGKGLNDLFFDPMKYSYDRGRRWNKTIGGHGNHVHLSV